MEFKNVFDRRGSLEEIGRAEASFAATEFSAVED